MFGWPAAARVLRPGQAFPSPFPEETRVRVAIAPTALYTEQQHVTCTDILVEVRPPWSPPSCKSFIRSVYSPLALVAVHPALSVQSHRERRKELARIRNLPMLGATHTRIVMRAPTCMHSTASHV